ncbi:RICIN domain-containing protein [Streptomyces cyaneofuscatus]|uniref:RICIN domain-containing protein n=1 Tax=Streptomyces cyaneofuscatus TaxID=66883 RepID=UPI0033341DB8
MRSSRLGLTAAILLALALGTATPASAAPNDGAITTLRATSYNACLDGNQAGRTYVSDCDRNNSYHRWQWIARGDGFQLRSQGTGRCLADDGSRIVTRTCNTGDLRQIWLANDAEFDEGYVQLLNNATSRYLAYASDIGLTGVTQHESYGWFPEAI